MAMEPAGGWAALRMLTVSRLDFSGFEPHVYRVCGIVFAEYDSLMEILPGSTGPIFEPVCIMFVN